MGNFIKNERSEGKNEEKMKEIQLYRGLLGGHSGKTKLESRLELRWEVEYMDVWGQAVGAGGGAGFG